MAGLVASSLGTPALAKEPIMVTPFRIPFNAAMVSDLQRRLDSTRWADAVTDDWSMGTERTFLEQLIRFWRHNYD